MIFFAISHGSPIFGYLWLVSGICTLAFVCVGTVALLMARRYGAECGVSDPRKLAVALAAIIVHLMLIFFYDVWSVYFAK
jgi:hypothetical protein